MVILKVSGTGMGSPILILHALVPSKQYLIRRSKDSNKQDEKTRNRTINIYDNPSELHIKPAAVLQTAKDYKMAKNENSTRMIQNSITC